MPSMMTGKRCPTGKKRVGGKGSKTCTPNAKSKSYVHSAGAVQAYTAGPKRCTNGYKRKGGMCHKK